MLDFRPGNAEIQHVPNSQFQNVPTYFFSVWRATASARALTASGSPR
jgi:hypothetical protein